MKIDTVKESWESYHRMVHGEVPISPTQYNETRKAFYAGYTSALLTLTGQVSAIEDESSAALKLQELLDEVQRFALESSK